MIWRWEVINDWIQGKGFKVGCEVGVKEGRFISSLLANNPDLFMCAVDPWEEQPDGNETYMEWEWSGIYKAYRDKIAPYKGRTDEIRLYSADAATLIDDGSLDFVFLDAQHDYQSVKQDIELWYPKVKDGGLVAGHDYSVKFPGVIQAVNEAFSDVTLGGDTVWGTWKN